ncbi:HAD family hydrolase [Tessaracoccus coleopterorum]|uniref:hypothetical protein n=1 Tax=Tessaracoccus coleopterorum TaxID=2714950 RepID=UPI001E2BD74C|nr:hypothetical protein [Tessaracoccus coleopterorum]
MRRQDGTLTEHALTLGEIIPLTDRDVTAALTQLVASDPTPNASMQAIDAVVPSAAEPWPLLVRAPFSSAKKWSGATFDGHGSWLLGAADVLADGEVAARAEAIGASGRRVLLLATSDVAVDSPAAPGTVTPQALLVLDQVTRADAADTLRYFREQDVAVKVISGDNAASVGAVTRSLGVAIGEVVDARTLPHPAPGSSTPSTTATCSAASRPNRSARWSTRCRPAATPSP